MGLDPEDEEVEEEGKEEEDVWEELSKLNVVCLGLLLRTGTLLVELLFEDLEGEGMVRKEGKGA